MIAFISRKKWFNPALIGACFLSLSGCYSLGQDKIEAEAQPFRLQACSSAKETQAADSAQTGALQLETEQFKLSLSFKGKAYPLPASQNIWGRTVRYVVPYTRHTLLLELEAENKQDAVLTLNPEQMTLSLPDSEQPLTPLPLAYFKQRWPAAAVHSQETMLDRAAALGEVTRTLFGAYPILPHAKQTGILPFPNFTLEKGQQIHLHLNRVQYGSVSQDLSFCLQAE